MNEYTCQKSPKTAVIEFPGGGLAGASASKAAPHGELRALARQALGRGSGFDESLGESKRWHGAQSIGHHFQIHDRFHLAQGLDDACLKGTGKKLRTLGLQVSIGGQDPIFWVHIKDL